MAKEMTKKMKSVLAAYKTYFEKIANDIQREYPSYSDRHRETITYYRVTIAHFIKLHRTAQSEHRLLSYKFNELEHYLDFFDNVPSDDKYGVIWKFLDLVFSVIDKNISAQINKVLIDEATQKIKTINEALEIVRSYIYDDRTNYIEDVNGMQEHILSMYDLSYDDLSITENTLSKIHNQINKIDKKTKIIKKDITKWLTHINKKYNLGQYDTISLLVNSIKNTKRTLKNH